MPAQPVDVRQLGTGGTVTVAHDLLGGVFSPVQGKAQRPVYTLGPKDAKGPLDVMYTCPVSGIPSEVWDLLHLWHGARLMGLPPVAGGFLDQPVPVQVSFPVFESLIRSVDSSSRAPERAAAMAVAGMVKALGGA